MTISKVGGIINAKVVLLTAPTSEMKSPKNGIASAKITENIKNLISRCEIQIYENYSEYWKRNNYFKDYT